METAPNRRRFGHCLLVTAGVLLALFVYRHLMSAALFSASAWGDTRQVKLLLALGASPNAMELDGDSHTALMEAVYHDHNDVVNILLAAGADINQDSGDCRGVTPLTAAASMGRADLVKLFLDRGAKIDTHDVEGFTPLLCAIEGSHVDCVKILLAHGAAIHVKTRLENITPLTLAQGRPEIEAPGRYGMKRVERSPVIIVLLQKADKETGITP